MAAKGRTSVDIQDIEEHIKQFRTDPAWRELSMSGKIRALLIEKIEEKTGLASQTGEEVRL
jgi:hypothetical protein